MPKVALFALTPLSLVLIAGCGFSGAAKVTPTQSPASTSSVPSQTSTSPSSTNTSPSATPTSSSTPSTNAATSLSSSARATTPSHYGVINTTVTSEIMQDLSKSHPGIPLAYPANLPPPPGPGFGYLTATTRATSTSWFVQLLDTNIPLSVDNPTIANHLSTLAPYVGSWGVTLLGSSLPVSTAPERAGVLRSQNPLWASSEAAIKASGSSRIAVGQNGATLAATAYTYNNGSKAKVMWTEGNWTIQVVGSTVTKENAMANSVVNYLHTHYLPPYPGLIMVQMTSATNAVTRIDWIQGDQLLHVATRQPMPMNPLVAAGMVVHWTQYH